MLKNLICQSMFIIKVSLIMSIEIIISIPRKTFKGQFKVKLANF